MRKVIKFQVLEDTDISVQLKIFQELKMFTEGKSRSLLNAHLSKFENALTSPTSEMKKLMIKNC